MRGFRQACKPIHCVCACVYQTKHQQKTTKIPTSIKIQIWKVKKADKNKHQITERSKTTDIFLTLVSFLTQICIVLLNT